MFSSAIVAASLALSALALPTYMLSKRANPTDIQVLQYALTLEHLEDFFYSSFLAKFSASDFEKAGYPSWVRDRFVQIGEHEGTHVSFLTSALGSDAVAACNYSFPAVTSPATFVATSNILEGVGVTAYLGAAQFLTNPTFLTAAGSILSTESRHNAWVGSAVQKGAPWSGAFDTPQTLNEVFTLASGFITSCPSSNPTLPVQAFPTLTLSPAAPTAGEKVTVSYNGTTNGTLFLGILSGLSQQFVPIVNKTATLPAGLQGTAYAVVSTNGTAVADATTVAGPAILNFPFSSSANNSGVSQE